MYRSGIGYDIHRTIAGRPLVLGGVIVPSAVGLDGHSDADVVLHALCDALLGAACLGDIGELFPNNDPVYRGMDSRWFVQQVVARLRAAGFRPVNADVSVLAESPRLSPHKPAMRAAIGEMLGLSSDCISVKAGTNEGIDAIGRGEAIACMAVVLLERI